MFYDSNGGRHSTVNEKGIYGFFGDYRYLSNFHVCNIEFDGFAYTSSEAAYMSCKTDSRIIKLSLTSMTPSQAKKAGQSIKLIPNWESERLISMTRVLFAKFKQNPDLAILLKSTGDKYLEETNDWDDRFWGANQFGNGQNMLGRILMLVRENI